MRRSLNIPSILRRSIEAGPRLGLWLLKYIHIYILGNLLLGLVQKRVKRGSEEDRLVSKIGRRIQLGLAEVLGKRDTSQSNV